MVKIKYFPHSLLFINNKIKKGVLKDTIIKNNVFNKKIKTNGKRKRNIKYFSKMNSQTLCEKLNIPYERNQSFDLHNKGKITISILFIHWTTGEKMQEFSSIYKTAKYLDVNPGSINNYIKNGKVIVQCGKAFKLIKKPQV